MAVAKAVSRGGGSSWRDKLRDDFNAEFGAAAPGSPAAQEAYGRLLDRTAATPVRGRAAEGSIPGWAETGSEAWHESLGNSTSPPPAQPAGNYREAWRGSPGNRQRAGTPKTSKQYSETWDNFLRGYTQDHGALPSSYGNPFGNATSRYEAITARLDELGLEAPDDLQQRLNYADSVVAYGRIIDDLGIEPYDLPPREEVKLSEGPPRLANEVTASKRQYQDITREQWDAMSDAQQKAVLHNTWLRRAETADQGLDGDALDEEILNRYHDSLTISNRGNSNSAYRPNTAAFLETFGLSGEDNLAAAQRRDIGITAADISQLRNFDIQLDTRPSAQRTGDSGLSDAERLVTNFEQRFQDLTGLGSGDPRGTQPKTQSELIRALDREFTRISSNFGSGARQESATDELGPLLGLGRTPDGSPDFRAELFDAIAWEGVPVDEQAITTLLLEQGITPEDFYNFAGQRIRAVQNSGGELPLGFTEGVWRDAEELKRLLNIREA